ncbi:MAG: hypothetical protein D6748_11655, partial [Calditrichaeota bacterium]
MKQKFIRFKTRLETDFHSSIIFSIVLGIILSSFHIFAAPTTTLFDTVTLSVSVNLTASPGDTVVVPVYLNRGNNDIAALGAALKATNGILSYIGFSEGPIIPGPMFNVNAPAPDSVRFAFVDFGGGPIVNDGVLVFLSFLVDPTAQNGDSSLFLFSDLSASDPNFNNLPIVGISGKLTIVLPAEIHGMKWNDLDGDGTLDPGEPGLSNWQITLSGDSSLSTTTDANGNYAFTNLNPGNYVVSEVLQSGWEQTAPPPPGTYSLTLNSGDVVTDINFGNWQPNHAPMINPIPDQTMNEGETLTVAVSATDPDGDNITLTALNLPTFGSFTDNGNGTGTLTFNPGFDDAGVYPNIQVIATDDGTPNLSDTTSFT